MSIGTVLGIAFITAMAGGILRQYNPTMALWVSLVGGGMVLLLCVGQMGTLVETMKTLLNQTGVETNFFWLMLKALGICYLCQFAVDLCNDAGETALAGYVELAGKIILVGLSLPMVEQIIELVVKLIGL